MEQVRVMHLLLTSFHCIPLRIPQRYTVSLAYNGFELWFERLISFIQKQRIDEVGVRCID